MTSERIKRKAVKYYLGAGAKYHKYFDTALAKKNGLSEAVIESMVDDEVDSLKLYDMINLEVAQQFIEIYRLLDNFQKLNVLRHDNRQPYYRQINVCKHIGYIEYALEILMKGKDTPLFNEKLKEYNDYIKEHIQIECFHKTFRTISKKEIKQEQKEKGFVRIHELKRRNLHKYDGIGQFFYELNSGREYPFARENTEKVK